MSEAIERPSHHAMVRSLEVGESHTLSVRLNQDEASSAAIADATERLHNRGRGLMGRVARETGRTFTGESGEWRTNRGHNPVLCFLITRTA